MNESKLHIPVHGLIGFQIGCLIVSGGLLFGCMSPSSESNPYDGLSCEAKIEKMTRELQEFEASKIPLAKAAAEDSIPTDTTSKTPIDSTRLIQTFQGFPPVTGMLGPDTNRLGGSLVDSRPNPGKVDDEYGIKWIPPVGFSDSAAPVPETTVPKPFPSDITAVKVISDGKYKAHVRILDYKNDPVREFDQEFGYQGELQNPSRVVAGGIASYLVWDNRTAAGTRAGDGVYLWDMRIMLESGQVQTMSAKTGLLGDECLNSR